MEEGEGEPLEEIKCPEIPQRLMLWVWTHEIIAGRFVEVIVKYRGCGRVIRRMGRGYLLDPAYNRRQIVAVMKEKFTCCMCNKSYRINEKFILDEIENTEPIFYEGFNILCGHCWEYGSRMRTKKSKNYKN